MESFPGSHLLGEERDQTSAPTGIRASSTILSSGGVGVSPAYTPLRASAFWHPFRFTSRIASVSVLNGENVNKPVEAGTGDPNDLKMAVLALAS